jgi:hypothetical protein
LYWPVRDGQPPSPLGELRGFAKVVGYTKSRMSATGTSTTSHTHWRWSKDRRGRKQGSKSQTDNCLEEAFTVLVRKLQEGVTAR